MTTIDQCFMPSTVCSLCVRGQSLLRCMYASRASRKRRTLPKHPPTFAFSHCHWSEPSSHFRSASKVIGGAPLPGKEVFLAICCDIQFRHYCPSYAKMSHRTYCHQSKLGTFVSIHIPAVCMYFCTVCIRSSKKTNPTKRNSCLFQT